MEAVVSGLLAKLDRRVLDITITRKKKLNFVYSSVQ